MLNKSFSILLFAILLIASARAQVVADCSVRIIVDDTILLTDHTVRFHLLPSASADSLHWYPDSLFADPTASSQWVTLGCDDTLPVKLTAYFHNVNLFHWKQPGFLQSHTGYDYIDSPTDGDLCSPRSITMNANPQLLCPELTTVNYQNAMIIRTDTLRCYGDSVPAFFDYDSTQMTAVVNMLGQSLRQVPFDTAYRPFYVDTIVMWDPNRTNTFVLNMNRYRFNDNYDTLAALPSIVYSVHIDDTAHHFFSVGHNIPLRDTTLVFWSIELPRTNLGPSQSTVSTHHFNSIPRPHGVAVFRFYETPTAYFNTVPYLCINRLEMLGDCWGVDSLLLTGPRCGCIVRDTVTRQVCHNQLPYHWYSLTFQQSGTDSVRIRSIDCDTLRYCVLQLLPDDTLSRHDTIVENQLPWLFGGETFTASGTDTLILSGTLPDCDTLIYYQLTVIDNIFDTTYTYVCTHQLPYTVAGTTVYGDTAFNVIYSGSYGEDSIVTYFLFVNPDSDTTLYDTIVSSQLPWGFLDSLFTDTVSNMPFALANEIGCDSIIYYNLYIFWEGDHCDSSLSFPNVVTPNGDGINDRFVIGGLVDNQCYPYNSLIIVDRTGRIVYHCENIYREDQFWDPAATRSPAGTYFYRFVGRGIHHATQHNGCIEVLK